MSILKCLRQENNVEVAGSRDEDEGVQYQLTECTPIHVVHFPRIFKGSMLSGIFLTAFPIFPTMRCCVKSI